jgi:hypothetical protein
MIKVGGRCDKMWDKLGEGLDFSFNLESPVGVEPTALRVEAGCSVH